MTREDPDPMTHREAANRILAALPWRDREVLIRFFARGQKVEPILQELGLTDKEFRHIKTQAKEAFAIFVGYSSSGKA